MFFGVIDKNKDYFDISNFKVIDISVNVNFNEEINKMLKRFISNIKVRITR